MQTFGHDRARPTSKFYARIFSKSGQETRGKSLVQLQKLHDSDAQLKIQVGLIKISNQNSFEVHIRLSGFYIFSAI